jgi:hypothetical protein
MRLPRYLIDGSGRETLEQIKCGEIERARLGGTRWVI